MGTGRPAGRRQAAPPTPATATLSTFALQVASTSTASSRFAPHNFQYNGRVALALLPSLAVLAGYGGNAVAAALAVS